jgi:hypothetical protein
MDPVNITQNNRSLRPNITRRVSRVSGVTPIRSYTVIEANLKKDLIQGVMDKSKEGYVLQGGISLFFVGSTRVYSQAMVKQ